MAMKEIKLSAISKGICQIAACLFCLFCITAYGTPKEATSTNAQLKACLESFIQKEHLAGAVVSYKLASQNPITLAMGYQNVESNIPMSADSYFAIGSTTKAFWIDTSSSLIQWHFGLKQYMQHSSVALL